VARNNSILKQLVLQAKKEHEAEAVHRIQIYFADSHGGWRWTDSRHKRPISSIVLNPGVKEMLLNDTKDFLKSEKVCYSRIFTTYITILTIMWLTVVRGPRNTIPSRLPLAWCPRLRQELIDPRYRRGAYA